MLILILSIPKEFSCSSSVLIIVLPLQVPLLAKYGITSVVYRLKLIHAMLGRNQEVSHPVIHSTIIFLCKARMCSVEISLHAACFLVTERVITLTLSVVASKHVYRKTLT